MIKKLLILLALLPSISFGTYTKGGKFVVSPDTFDPASDVCIDGGNATASSLRFTNGTTSARTSSDGSSIGIGTTSKFIFTQNELATIEFITNGITAISVATTGAVSIPAISGTLTGNASTSSALAANPTDCTSGQFANAIAANGDLTCSTPSGAGDVSGPASATDEALVRFDGTTGKLIQNSGATLSDLGNLTASSFIGPLTGNADTATALAANPTDCGAGTKAITIAANGNLTCTAVSLTADVSGVLPNANTTATSANTVSTIVARDSSGNFSAGTISAAITGNATTATALAANPADCGAGTKAISIVANGDLTCTAVNLAADVSTTVLPIANGGTNKALTLAAGSVVWDDSNSFEVTAVGSTGQVLQSGGATTPTWSTPTYPSASGSAGKVLRSDATNNVYSTFTIPDTAVTSDLLYASATNVWSSLAKSNSSALISNSSGVPAWTAGTVANRLLRTDGTSIAFGQAVLTTDVTGVLPNANTTATSANTVSAIVARDSSGNFSAGTISAALTGNATTSTALASNPTDCGAGTKAISIDASGNLTCSAVSLTADVSGVLPNANTTAASANTVSAIVARDSSGNFSAGTITAALTGNASTSTALAANPTDCSAGEFATTIAASGNLTCAAPSASGYVVGPASATDNAITRFDGTTGKLIQNSGATIDDSGNVTGVSFIGPLTGNSTTATALAANPTDCSAGAKAISIDASGNLTCTAVSLTADVSGVLPNANTTAASANTASAIVARDASGNFSAGTITAALTGNASTATALAANPADCGAGTKAISIVANGDLTCSAVSMTADISGVTPIANGGTNKALTLAAGSVVWDDADSLEVTAVGSAGQILQSGGTTTPTWSTPTYPSASGSAGKVLRADGTNNVYSTFTIPDTVAANGLLYGSATNVWSVLAGSNTSALISNSSGVPAWALGTTANRLLRTDGTTVSFSQAALATDVSGVLPIANGGTNKALTLAAGAVAWTDADSFEVSAAGTSGQALISGGTTTPTWFAPTAGSVLFAGTSGILQQDNASLFFNDTTNFLGIGIVAPTNKLHIDAGTATASNVQWTAGTTTNQTANDGFEVGVATDGVATINQQENAAMSFLTNATVRETITADGQHIFSSVATSQTVGSVVPKVQVNGTGNSTASQSQTIWSANNNAGIYFFGKSRGATVGTNSAALSGDPLGEFRFFPDDGTGFNTQGANIRSNLEADASVGATTANLRFFVNNGTSAVVQAMEIDPDGDVGIGTTSAVARLDVSSNVANTPSVVSISRSDTGVGITDVIGTLQFWNNDSQLTTQQVYGNIEVQSAATVITDAAAGNMIFRTTGTTVGGSPVERMRIDSSGNLALGIATATNKFHMDNGTATTNYHQLTANATTGTASTDGLLVGLDASANAIFNQQEALPMIWYTSGLEKMRLDSTGNLMLGVSTQLGAFSVKGNGASTNPIETFQGAMGTTRYSFLNNGTSNQYLGGASSHNVNTIVGITHDASASGVTTAAQNTVTWSHTVGTGSNKILIVGVSMRETAPQTVSTVTFGAASLTLLETVTRSNARAELWYLVNPTTSTDTITVTLASAATDRVVGGSSSYFNVDQTTPFGTTSETSGNSTSASLTPASSVGDLVIDVLSKQNSTDAITAGGSQTERWDATTVAGADAANAREMGGGSSLTGTDATTSMSWSWPTNNRAFAYIAVALKPTYTAGFTITAKGHEEFGGTVPAVASGAADCGTSPAIVGNDNVGRITVGSVLNGGVCTVTFANSWTNAPICVVTNETTANLVRATATTTTVAFTGTFVAADKLAFTCRGYK